MKKAALGMGRIFFTRSSLRLVVAVIAAVAAACAASSGQVETGMTSDQAIRVMGQPDLRDTVPDPRGGGASVFRYAWVSQGKVATFGSDNRVAAIGDLPRAGTPENASPATASAPDAAIPSQIQGSFDPIQTPLNYVFYPLRFALTWLGAGVNCVAEGDCRRPQVRPPDAG